MAIDPMRYHVEPVGNAWKVSPGPDSQPESLHSAKQDAIAAAERLARKHHGGEVVVHRNDGTIEQLLSMETEHHSS